MNCIIFLEVGKEVQCRLEDWQSKLQEIEQRFLELTAVCSSLVTCTSKGKKRGTKKQKMSNDESSQLSDYVAEVFYHFFSKVQVTFKN